MSAPITTRAELEEAIKHRAEEIVEDIGFAWNEIPGAIAEATVINLTIEVAGRLPNGPNTTLADLGWMLGVYDEEGNPQ